MRLSVPALVLALTVSLSCSKEATHEPSTLQARGLTRSSDASKAPEETGKEEPQPPIAQAPAPCASDTATTDEVAVVAVLTGLGGGGFMSDTDQGASLDESIRQAQGAKLKEHRKENAMSGNTTTKVQAKLGSVEALDSSSVTTQEVSKRIRGKYLAGLKRCYLRGLKKNPKMAVGGKVKISLTVGPTGRVTESQANGFNANVDECMAGQARKWRFAAPKDEAGKSMAARFTLPLLLKSDAP